jgi:hypothetical protein
MPHEDSRKVLLVVAEGHPPQREISKRRSTAKMTLDTYTQVLGPHTRAGQSKVLGMIRH